MFRNHVHVRAITPAAGWPATVVAVVALLLTTVGTAAAAPSGDASPADLTASGTCVLPGDGDGADFGLAAAGPVMVTSDDVPWWVHPRDARYQRERTVDWNTRFRPGRGAVSVVTEFNSYKADERDDDAYLENARVLEFFPTVELRGVVYNGVALSAEIGASAIQIRPDGDDGFDRYEYSYRAGAGIDVLGSLSNFVAFGATARFQAWEARGHDSNNAQVAANGGNDIILRAYLIRADLRMVLELAGSRDGAFFNLEVGGSFQYQWTRLIGDTETLGFRQFPEDQFNVLGGLVFGVGTDFTLHAEVRLLGIINGRLSLQLWF